MSRESLALARKAREVFAREAAPIPPTTLRAGNAIDEFRNAPCFDATVDATTDEYLERYSWGVGYLDSVSWKHYLPPLIDYALRHMGESSLVIDALLTSLRPPDREPPRLGSLSTEQEAVLAEVLHVLAFGSESANQERACQVLEEWWIPGALYRTEST